MAIKRAGQLVINVTAGTAQLIADLEAGNGHFRKFASRVKGDVDAAKASVREFGATIRQQFSGSGTPTDGFFGGGTTSRFIADIDKANQRMLALSASSDSVSNSRGPDWTSRFASDLDAANAKVQQLGATFRQQMSSTGGSTPLGPFMGGGGTLDTIAEVKQISAATGEAGQAAEQFGQKHAAAHGKAISDVQATSAGIRVLKGELTNNVAAAENFLATTLKLGPVMQAAFPVIGAVALIGVVGELGEKVHEMYREIHEGAERARGAFDRLNAPLRLTNDELQLANDRLAADIAKLEGAPQNNLVIGLDEARVAADRLAESLDRDLERVHKLLEEQNVGLFRRFLGEAGTSDIAKRLGGETGLGGFRGEVSRIASEGREQVAAATTIQERNAAQAELNRRLKDAYEAEIKFVQDQVRAAEEAAKPGKPVQIRGADGGAVDFEFQAPGKNEAVRLEVLRGLLEQLQYENAGIDLRSQNFQLTERKDAAAQSRESTDVGRPFEDRMQSMSARIDGLRAKLESVGQPESARILAEAFGRAQQSIAEIDKQLAKHHSQLTDQQRAQILVKESTIALVEGEIDWQTRLTGTTSAIEERIRAQERLSNAVRAGFEATREAAIEGRLRGELGARADDPEFMRTHAADIERLRTGFAAEFDAETGRRATEAIDSLNRQIALERDLAAVQSQGAEAIRQVTLAHRVRGLETQGATKEQIKAEVDLFQAQRATASAGNVATLEARLAGVRRITAALLDGAEAERKAALEAKYAEMERGGATPDEIAATRSVDVAERQREVTSEALRTGRAYRDQLETIDQQIEALERLRESRGATFEIEVSLRELQNQRLRALADEALAGGTARDGLRAFMIEMRRETRTEAETVYGALIDAQQGVSGQIAKAATGQKTDFGGTFQRIGEGLVQSSTDRLMRKGISWAGDLFGVDTSGFAGAPDGSRDSPFYVRLADAAALPGMGGGLKDALDLPDEVFKGAKKAGGFIFSALGGLFGGFRASGGPVDPSRAYIVGERGPEVFMPGAAGYVVPNHQMGGVTNVYNVNAPNAELGAWNRIQRGLELTHRMAVTNSMTAQHEREQRMPPR